MGHAPTLQCLMYQETNAEQAFDKIQHPLMIKALKRMGIGTKFLTLAESINKTTSSIIVHGKELKAFPFPSGTRQGCPLSPLLSNSLEIIPILGRLEKGIRRSQIRMEEVKLPLLVDIIIIYIYRKS